MPIQRSLSYSRSNQAKRFFKKHPELEREFLEALKEIVSDHSALKKHDIKPYRGLKHGFRYRKGDKRIKFIMTADNKIMIVEVKEANNRGDIY